MASQEAVRGGDVAAPNDGAPLKPALASIPAACKYMGDVSRAKFYSDILPKLETVHVGTRHLVLVSSMDALISNLLEKDSPPTSKRQARARRAVHAVKQ
jgi:hypothetical protein